MLLPAAFLHHPGAARTWRCERLANGSISRVRSRHYSGSLETRLAADVNVARDASRTDALGDLIRMAQEPRTPGVGLTADDLSGKTSRSPLLKLMQLRAVQNGAQSWWSHRAITDDPLSKGLSVEVHHIFPRAWLKNGLERRIELDTLANFRFLENTDNIKISDGDPAQYLKDATQAELEAQWVPLDPGLWQTERFEDFSLERRRLIASSLNEMLGLTTSPGGRRGAARGRQSPELEIGAWAEDGAFNKMVA